MSKLNDCKAKSDELVSQVKDLEEQVSQQKQSITKLEQQQAELKSDRETDPVKLAERMAACDRDIQVAQHTVTILKSRIAELIVTAPDRLAELKRAYREHTTEIDEYNDKAKETFLDQPAIKDALGVLRQAYSRGNPENRDLEEFLVHIGWNSAPAIGCESPGYRSYDHDSYELTQPVESLVNSAAYREYQPEKREPISNAELYHEPSLNRVR